MKKILRNVVTDKFCFMCKNDSNIFCPRNVDVKCLICSVDVCGGHIIEHLKKHCVSANLDHCTKEDIK